MLGDSIPVDATLIVNEVADTAQAISWSTFPAIFDGGSLSIDPAGPRRLRVRGTTAGPAGVFANAAGASAGLQVWVRAPAAPGTPPSIVIDDFYVVEYKYPSDVAWRYSPQLVLRSAGTGESVVIAASFDVPGLAPGAPCALRRSVGPAPAKLFYEEYQEMELILAQRSAQSHAGQLAVAHLTVRTPDGTAVRMTATGPIGLTALPMDAYFPPGNDAVSCW